MDIMVKHHGFPKTIISYHDKISLSSFLKILFDSSGTKLKHSSTYHPQTDMQTEVVNKDLSQYLHAMVMKRPDQWANLLGWVEYCYNTGYNSNIGISPYQALYGKHLPYIIPYEACNTSNAVVYELLTDHDKLAFSHIEEEFGYGIKQNGLASKPQAL